MTELQGMRIRSLAAANLGQNQRAATFIRDLARRAENNPDAKLTERQAGYLIGLAWSFRRQIPAALRPAQNPYESHQWSQREDDTDENVTAEEIHPLDREFQPKDSL